MSALALPLLALLTALPPGPAPAPIQAVGSQESRPAERRQLETGVMGTELKITVLGPDAEQLETALAAAETEIRRVEDLMTDWRASPLMELNDAAGLGPVAVPEELYRLIARSLEISRLTGGAFDVTYAAAGKLWDFKAPEPHIPDQAEIDAALTHVGYDRVVAHPDGRVTLPEGMRIGLGGVAKGYGVDRAMAVLMEHGVKHAIVNAGGDLKALGRDGEKLWEIAIKHPRERERALALVPLSNVCLVTSGDYERFFEHQGKRYHHIIDPRTGFPATGCMSATVLAPDAAFADALATALCVLGPVRGLELIESLPRVEALLVGMDGQVHATQKLQGQVEK